MEVEDGEVALVRTMLYKAKSGRFYGGVAGTRTLSVMRLPGYCRQPHVLSGKQEKMCCFASEGQELTDLLEPDSSHQEQFLTVDRLRQIRIESSLESLLPVVHLS